MSLVNQYNFPVSLCCFLGDFPPFLLFSLYFPYQSILIIGHLTLHLCLFLLFLLSLHFPLCQKRQKKERKEETQRDTNTHNEAIHLSNQRGGSPEESKHPSLSRLFLSLSLFSLSHTDSCSLRESVSVHDYDAPVCVFVCVDRRISYLSGVSLKRIDCSRAANKE